MIIITTDRVVETHNYIIKKTGGGKGILNLGSIDFLIFELDNEPDKFKKASIVLKGIITRHPFIDGNKRTAFLVADNILIKESYYIHTNKDQIKRLLLKIAKYECEIEDINKWLKKYTQLGSRKL